jgi:basic amino acid/polyamine antiporter, APA family
VATVVSVGGVTAMLGVILSQLLGLSRMAFAMARRGDLPRVAGARAPPVRRAGPGGAGDRRDRRPRRRHRHAARVASAASFTILVYYGIANVAALRMPRRKLFPDAVPAVGLVSCAVLALSLTPRIIIVGLMLLAVGALVRLLMRRFAAAPEVRR